MSGLKIKALGFQSNFKIKAVTMVWEKTQVMVSSVNMFLI